MNLLTAEEAISAIRRLKEKAMNLLTAEEALELSGFESALLLIDKEMREQAGQSLRFLYLRFHEEGWIPESQVPDVIESLRARGFSVEKQTNPLATIVTW